MGQPIQVAVTQIDDVLLFDTDRSITGQDGVVFSSHDEALDSDRFPAQLAARIFAADSGVNHVFVASNQVVVRRSSGWDTTRTEAASAAVSDFFLYYPDAANV